MKKISSLFLIFLLAGVFAKTYGQWNLTGNSNATAASLLGTTNAIPLNLATNNVKRLVIDATGKIGIGIATPVNILSVKGSGGTPAASWVNAGAPLFTGFGEQTVGNSDYILSMASTLANARPVFIGRRGRGTLAAPAAITNNDYLMSILSSGYDGSAFQNPAAIDFYADGAPTAGNVPARISFVTGSNSANRAERMKIGSSGDITVTNGNLIMGSDTKTIQFALPGISSLPMINMFPSGTANKPRMVIAHSPTYPNWGLQYVDSVDKFDFVAGGSSIMAVNLGSGGVDINAGSLKFANGYQGIQFGTPIVGGPAMITMFPSGTQNPTRMLVAHSAAYPNYGIQYNDTLDSWQFVASGNVGVSIDSYGNENVANQLTAQYVYSPYIYSSATTSGNLITAYNYGTGNGMYGYTAGGPGSDPYGTSGVYGYNNGTGYGVGGYGTTGAGVYGYSPNYVGVWGSTANTGSYAGYFQGNVYTTGTYTSSDRKLKKDIAEMTSGMDIISKLKPKTYEFRQDGNYKLMNLPQGKQYGLIAQDLEEVLPNLVKQSEFDPNMVQVAKPAAPGKHEIITSLQGANTAASAQAKPAAEVVKATPEEKIDFKAVNYTELVPIIIKGMQEQQAVIEQQNAKIAALTEMVEKLSPGATKAAANVHLSSAGLEQNVPNPPVNNSTYISYNVPKSSSKAELVITDIYGRKVKEISLGKSGKGSLNIDTKGLNAGTYSYTLYIDGKMTETKKMLIAAN